MLVFYTSASTWYVMKLSIRCTVEFLWRQTSEQERIVGAADGDSSWIHDAVRLRGYDHISITGKLTVPSCYQQQQE